MSDSSELTPLLEGQSSPPFCGNDNNHGSTTLVVTATTAVTTRDCTGSIRLALFCKYVNAIQVALCNNNNGPSADKLVGFSEKVANVLYKLACAHIAGNKTSNKKLSMILEVIRCGQHLIDDAIEFANTPDNSDEKLSRSGCDKERSKQIIRHGIQCYCGLVMLFGAFLFWSTVFPEIELAQNFSLSKIDVAPGLYENLLGHAINAQDLDDDDDDDDEEERNETQFEPLLKDAGVAMFDEVTKKCEIIEKISDYLAKKEYLKTICPDAQCADDDDGVENNAFRVCPKNLLEWANCVQQEGDFSHDVIMSSVQMYHCRNRDPSKPDSFAVVSDSLFSRCRFTLSFSSRKKSYMSLQ
ncbi:hypothetical protein H4219_004133 [Mycoemilia scoparia]|uniref:Uncharacterized protein n=1 Tax=Mycoemilia scoparia TaxID=417184 RepID=A0A9W7ZZ79_9FUNG|nr:hypothetical protein H4219_004133 [Mycoemilia scoparia]